MWDRTTSQKKYSQKKKEGRKTGRKEGRKKGRKKLSRLVVVVILGGLISCHHSKLLWG
jgi:flagellar biosynthesis/type III secretory pathway protein FliH